MSVKIVDWYSGDTPGLYIHICPAFGDASPGTGKRKPGVNGGLWTDSYAISGTLLTLTIFFHALVRFLSEKNFVASRPESE